MRTVSRATGSWCCPTRHASRSRSARPSAIGSRQAEPSSRTTRLHLYDELGVKRSNFGLADVFGVDWIGTYNAGGQSGTLYVPQGDLKGKYGQWLGFCGQHTEIRPRESEDLDVLYTLSVRRGFALTDPAKDTHDSGHPGVVEHAWGKGKSIYISGDVGEGFCDHPLQRVREFFVDLVKRGGLRVEVSCPSRVLVHALYGEQGTLHVHLYHRFCQMTPWERHHIDSQQWSALDEPFPVHDIQVTVAGGGIKHARMPLRDLDLEVEERYHNLRPRGLSSRRGGSDGNRLIRDSCHLCRPCGA